MAWKSEYVDDFFEDTKEKSITAKSARNRRGRNGRSGPVKMPSDYLTDKQRRSMDGECKTYRLGAPMNWEEFMTMPDDLKVMYIKKLRKEYFVPDDILSSSMCVELDTFERTIKSLGLSPRKNEEYKDTDNCGRFLTWWVVKEG